MTDQRKELIASMANALYNYATTASLAKWDNKRHGLNLPSIHPTVVGDCGAFRAWEIHCHDGKVCFSIDGYVQRDHRKTGSVRVIVGNGHFVFPHDDSCGHHSLEMQTTAGARLVNVTDDPSINWEPRIIAMCEVLIAAKEEIDRRVKQYDDDIATSRIAQRRADTEAARMALETYA